MIVEDLDSPYTSPQQVVPVDGAAYGLGIRHVEEGLDFVFERWVQLREGDTYRMWMNGVTVAEGVVEASELSNPRFFLNVPRTTVELGFVPDVYGEVVRVGSTTPSTSIPQVVFIKDTRPGGADERPHEHWHSKLILTLSDTTIGADMEVTATIKAWENMRVNDLVMFYWGGERFDVPPITQAQVDRDLVFVIGQDFLELVGSGHYVVQFYLYDEVRNRSGELQPWCKPVPVYVDLGLTLLQEPEVIQDDQVTLVVDADLINTLPVTAEVLVRRQDPFLVGDHIYLTVQGISTDGSVISESLRLYVDSRSKTYVFPIKNDTIRALIQSTMTVSYVRERAGEADLPSRKTTVTIGGTRYELPRPSVREAVGPFIPPDLPRITVAMPDYQPPGTAADQLEVVIEGKYLDGTAERESTLRFAGSHPRTRDFSNAQYMRFEGLNETNVHYNVTGASGVRASERAWVQIGRPARTLLAPVIIEAVNGNVDPATVGSVGTLELRAQFKAGDRVVVRFTGSSSGDQEFEYDLFLTLELLVLDIPKSLFTNNVDGTLTVSYWIDRYNVIQYSEELQVTIGTALGQLFLPQVLQATTEPDELDPAVVWPHGATVRVSYEFIKRGDQIQVCWRGLPGLGTHYEVKEDQAGDFIDFTIPTPAIGFNIHPDGRDIHVSFKVIRNGYPTESPVLTLRLLALHNLPGPLIDSIGDSAVLEIPLLQDLDRTRVQPWIYAQAEQRMWLSYEGTFFDGSDYEDEVLRARPVSAAEASNGVASFTPVALLRNLKDWTALTIRFWVTFNQSNSISDAVLFEVRHHVIQKESNVFPYPEINLSTPASGESVSIDPVASENKCQVLVRYPNMNQGGTDRITLHWIYEDGTMPFISSQDGLDGGTVTFNISNDILGSSVGTTINLQYFVELGRGGSGNSEVQTVAVKDILPANLVRALINNVSHGGSLNPPSLTGDAMAASPKWRLSVKGQRVWLTVTTSAAGIAPLHLLTSDPITPIQQANGLSNIPVSRAWLLSLPANAHITVHMKVTFDGSEDEARATVFPSTEYTISLTKPLVFDTSTAYLSARTYLMPDYPTYLPAFGSGNSVRRTASGGTPAYFYSSSNTGVAVVDTTGYVTVRGNGTTTITVRDSSLPAQTRSYVVSVSGVVLCYGLGGGTKPDIDASARNKGVRLASLNELRELSLAYGSRWPMGNGPYWSSTWSHNLLFFDYWWGRNINTGAEGTYKQWVGSQLLGVGLR
ncbi:hypothetical protein CQZ99_04935 [Pseudomonas poae]|uniref:BIG2 domain-containing protein n=2 Tax=Pseudomonas poae TaxID=200451 RepID=A0A2S9EXB9_9PSED|nr:hypothetical protein CQZ97_02095 [Pseudomonas poae]PRC21368.1 hypothetical protein CQZ99_04935 [Pseudomonas poae]